MNLPDRVHKPDLFVSVALVAVLLTASALAPPADASSHTTNVPRSHHQPAKVAMRASVSRLAGSDISLAVSTQTPTNGASLRGTIPWKVSTTGERVSRVEFAVDGVVKWTDRQTPFSYGNGLDTTKLANGGHRLTATAYTRRGLSGSATIAVTVVNSIPAPSPEPTPTPESQPASPEPEPTPTPTPTPAPEPTPTPAPEPTPEPAPESSTKRLRGIWDDPGSGNMIWNASEWDSIESHFGRQELIHYGQPWGAIDSPTMALAASRGGTPLLDVGNSASTPEAILNGSQDKALAEMQNALAAYGKEVILRPLWEMNGNWYPWGQKLNYAAAWRYMHERITAPNVKWLWCPNYRFAGSSAAVDPTPYYPGDKWVDYVGADIYMENWTAHQAADLILSDLHRIAPSKQAIIAEWGVSASRNPNRPATIREFQAMLPSWVTGEVYFNWNTGGPADWRLDGAGITAYNNS